MQENEKVKVVGVFRKGLAFLSALFVLVAVTCSLDFFEDETDEAWLPMRSLRETVQELPGNKFQVRTRFQYKLNGEWLTKDVIYPVATFGWAKRLELAPPEENPRVVFDKDSPDCFRFSTTESLEKDRHNQRLTVVFTFLVLAWLVFAMRKLNFLYASMVYLFLFSVFLSWLSVSLLADQLKVARDVSSWTRVEAHLDFYEMNSLFTINTRYRYSLEGKDYSGGWVALGDDPLLPPHTVAWAMLTGSRTVTCYVNPDNPDQSCLTKINSLSVIPSGFLFLLALGIQWLLYRAIFRRGVPLNSRTRPWGLIGKSVVGLSLLYLLTWVPSLLVFLQTSSLGSIILGLSPLGFLGLLVGWLWYRVRRSPRTLNDPRLAKALSAIRVRQN